MPQNFNHIVLSQQAAFESLTTPIIADGAVTSQKIGTLASVVIQDLTYTAATGGTSGNAISIAYIEDVLPGRDDHSSGRCYYSPYWQSRNLY